MAVKFVKPKKKNTHSVDWKVSDRTRAIVKYYSEYTDYPEEELVDQFLTNILSDKDFMEWIEGKRYKKRIYAQIFETEE